MCAQWLKYRGRFASSGPRIFILLLDTHGLMQETSLSDNGDFQIREIYSKELCQGDDARRICRNSTSLHRCWFRFMLIFAQTYKQCKHTFHTLYFKDGVHVWPAQLHTLKIYIIMTSSNLNIFRVTGPFFGEFTVPRWIPLWKASDTELWCFLWSASE